MVVFWCGRYGPTGRRRQTEVDSASVLRQGTNTRHATFVEQKDDQRNGQNDSRENSRNGADDANKTALDTLSTILSSSCTYDDGDWDPFVNTMGAPLDDTAACIRPGLYISGFFAEQNRADLECKGITHILQVWQTQCVWLPA